MLESSFDGWVNWRKLFSNAVCLGTTEVNDKICYRLLAFMKHEKMKEEGKGEKKPGTRTLYFDMDSHLLVRIEARHEVRCAAPEE